MSRKKSPSTAPAPAASTPFSLPAPAPRVAIVTGAARGIGRAIAARLAADGLAVVFADTGVGALKAAVAALPAGSRALAVPVDVSREASVARLIARTIRHFGGLDVLVNNAGIADPVSGPIERLALAEWNRLLATNLTGMFLCAKHAVPHLKARPGAAIVNLSSTRARMSEPDTEAYSASKGGIEALTSALSISLGPIVRVNAIAPGWIVTDPHAQLSRADHAQHPVGRAGVPEDIAGLAAWLISPQAGFVTGQVFTADGGMTRKMIYVA